MPPLQCPACQFDLGEPREVCPRCGRFVYGTPSRPSLLPVQVRRRDSRTTDPAAEFDRDTGAPTDPGRRQSAHDIPLAQLALGPLPTAVAVNAPEANTDPPESPPAAAPSAPMRPSKVISKRAAMAAGLASESGTRRSPSTIGKSNPSPSSETALDLKLDVLIGKMIAGKYQIQELIAVGGMGKVYKALHKGLDRTVAVKMLKPSLLDDQTIVGRFEREAKAASRLTHPNAIQVFDFGDDGNGSLFLAMEFVQGRDLRQLLLKEHPLGEARVAHVMAQVLAALADAHAQGIVHRDLKPENVMVESRRGEPDFVKVLDFGIAKILSSDQPTLTLADRICGTPLYMAPEQATGSKIDGRADVYACGVILYQLVTGVLPFYSQNTVELLTKHVNEKPLAPRLVSPELAISADLEALILKAMAKNPDERPQSAEEFRRALLALPPPPAVGAATPLAPPREVKPLSPDLLAKNPSQAPPTPPQITPPKEQTTPPPDPAEPPARPWTRGLVAGGLGALAIGAMLMLRAPAPAPAEPAAVAPPVPPAAAPALAPATPLRCAGGMQLVKATGFAAVCVDERGFPNKAGLKPRVKVTWANAKALCEEHGKRLCTEAEWERACQAAPPDVAAWTATLADGAGKTYAVRGLGKPDARCTTRKALATDAKDPAVGLRCCADPG